MCLFLLFNVLLLLSILVLFKEFPLFEMNIFFFVSKYPYSLKFELLVCVSFCFSVFYYSILLFNGFLLFEMNIFLISKYPYSLRLSRGKIWLKCFFNSHVKHYLQHRTTITTFPVYSC